MTVIDVDRWPEPQRITWALDAPMAEGATGPLEGPCVDEFCGVAEPTVDLWETGEVIPSDEELTRLAELTGYPVEWFYRPVLDMSGAIVCVSSGPRHGCYSFTDPALDKAIALADVAEVSRVPKPVQVDVNDGRGVHVRAPKRERRRVVSTVPASMPECRGCQAPMRRTRWVELHGRCSNCGPA